tara:strand:- start:488 stop:1306 length:819 start_codon:yes stop_codon:yes gene_type:complete
MPINERRLINPGVAFELLQRGIWIPHLKGVTDADGNLYYWRQGFKVADYDVVLLGNYTDQQKQVHDLVAMANKIQANNDHGTFWESVLNYEDIPKIVNGQTVWDHENGKPKLRFQGQRLWDMLKGKPGGNVLIREQIRSILTALEFSPHQAWTEVVNPEGHKTRLAGEYVWGLSFSAQYYKKNGGLCWSFFSRYQERLGELGQKWEMLPCKRDGIPNFRQLVVHEQLEGEDTAPPEDHGFEAPVFQEQPLGGDDAANADSLLANIDWTLQGS